MSHSNESSTPKKHALLMFLKNKFLYIIATILILLGITLMFFSSFLTNKTIDHLSDNVLENKAGTSYAESVKVVEEKENVTYDFTDAQELTMQDVLDAQFASDKPYSIGAISVPDLSMELPILLGVSDKNMRYGAATMVKGTEMGKGNYSLAGHNMRNERTLFSPLINAKKGMYVYLTDFKKTYVYKIEDIYTVDPSRVDVIETHGKRVETTLVTCNFLGKKRQIIHATYKNTLSIQDTPKHVFKRTMTK